MASRPTACSGPHGHFAAVALNHHGPLPPGVEGPWSQGISVSNPAQPVAPPLSDVLLHHATHCRCVNTANRALPSGRPCHSQLSQSSTAKSEAHLRGVLAECAE